MPKNHAPNRVSNNTIANSLPQREIQRLASFPRLNPSPILECDLSGTITYCNPAALAVLEQMGLTDARVFLPDDFPEIVKTLGSSQPRTIYRECMIQNRVFQENLYLASEFKTVRIYALDVTKHKQIEQALRTTETQLHFILHNTPMFVFAWDAQGVVTFCKGRSLERLGIDPDEILGKPVAEMNVFALSVNHNENAMTASEVVRRTLDGERLSGLANVNGVYLDIKIVPVLDADQVTAVVGVAVDVTQRVDAEEQIKQKSNELERWQDATLYREDHVQELKREVNALLARLGEPPRYTSQVE